MTFPNPETVDVLAEVADWLTENNDVAFIPVGTNPVTIKSLAQYAGTPTTFVTANDQRSALVKLAAHAVARVELIDRGRI